ncbi:hypothetical protein C8J57DRAFT_1238973 [Mycena rebaudengoi]|nr:hypothetical protein C8J57DRAFT_1238973 [Mycena rebaudengoi]
MVSQDPEDYNKYWDINEDYLRASSETLADPDYQPEQSQLHQEQAMLEWMGGPLDSQFGSLEYVLELYAENNLEAHLMKESCHTKNAMQRLLWLKSSAAVGVGHLERKGLAECNGHRQIAWGPCSGQDGACADREKADKWEAKAESATWALQDIQARLGDVQEQLEFGIF